MSKAIRVAYLMLCHDCSERIINKIKMLLAYDDNCCVFIHLDKKMNNNIFDIIFSNFKNDTRCFFIRKNKRISCHWGTWSIVRATLCLIEIAYHSSEFFSHFFLVSEFCIPVKSNKELKEFFEKNLALSYIDIYDKSWIQAGIRDDRYLFRHILDKRKMPKLHRYMYRVQKKIGLRRKVPSGLKIKFGSQWWCLTYEAIHRIMTDKNIKKKEKFFKYVWIPDESFFSTIVSSYDDLYTNSTLTYSEFDSATGKCKSINEIIIPEKYFFARKDY